MKTLTKRAIRRCGSIKNTTITEMEKIEYRQTGMIKVKEPLSVGCKRTYDILKRSSYYDVVETPLYKLIEDIDLYD